MEGSGAHERATNARLRPGTDLHVTLRAPIAVDFFSGMGGLSTGFAGAGFDVQGFDADSDAVATYELNVGRSTLWDARSGYPDIAPDVVLGGPPCRPWSAVNVTRRGEAHRDYHLVHDLIAAIAAYRPAVFAIENVPAVRNHLESEADALRDAGYSAIGRLVRYSEWGAPSSRRRYFILGSRIGSSLDLWQRIEDQKRDGATVRDAMSAFRDLPKNGFADHEWGEFKTIDRYRDKYATGQFGWYRLEWDKAAPSFGNVGKTYILHPDHQRVISVREAMAVLGFPPGYRFPPEVPRTSKYRMAADAVSPDFSNALGLAVMGHLQDGPAHHFHRGQQLKAWGS